MITKYLSLFLLSLSYLVSLSLSKVAREKREQVDPLLTCNSGQCEINTLGDRKCNTECLTADCNYDLGDCCVNVNGCAKPLISNGVCDNSCKVSECAFDWDDCLEEDDIDISLFPFCAYPFTTNEGFPCNFSLLTNGKCDLENGCDASLCNFDAFDCEGDDPEELFETCNAGRCTLRSLGNGDCDPQCLTPDCNYDLGDCCNGISGCSKSDIDNDNCDVGCLLPECAYDWDDCSGVNTEDRAFCTFLPGCKFEELLDMECTQNCTISECNFDFRDCNESYSLTLETLLAVFAVACVILLCAFCGDNINFRRNSI